MSNEFDDDFKMDDNFANADTWEEQCAFIASLMELEEQLDLMPDNWQDNLVEPDPDELALMDENAQALLESLQ